jgi:transcription elongation GreA/GreB family factor
MKAQAIELWRAILTERLAALLSSQDAARSGTRVDGEHRPSNRGERAAVTSQGYLAHGLGERATALQNHLENLDKMGQVPRNEVVIGALLTVCIDDGPTSHIILLPGGDATEVQFDGTPIQVLSASSPMARQLRDSVAGDAEEIELGGRFVEIELLAIE